MEATRSLQEQTKECEEWCADQEEKAYLPSARKGLRVLPAHHGALATPLAGCELRPDGGVFKEKPLGLVMGGLMIVVALMVLVGFSGGVDMGIYCIIVYVVVQVVDGNIIVPMVAKKTADLAPALVLGAQLIMGALFGLLGLILADPLVAMIKVALERQSQRNESA